MTARAIGALHTHPAGGHRGRGGGPVTSGEDGWLGRPRPPLSRPPLVVVVAIDFCCPPWPSPLPALVGCILCVALTAAAAAAVADGNGFYLTRCSKGAPVMTVRVWTTTAFLFSALSRKPSPPPPFLPFSAGAAHPRRCPPVGCRLLPAALGRLLCPSLLGGISDEGGAGRSAAGGLPVGQGGPSGGRG